MIIEFYSNVAEKNKVGKMPQALVKSLTGTLRESTNVTDPIFKVTTLTHDEISKINYAYVPEFKRYYFVKQITYVKKDLYEVNCHVDVLESFKDDILNLNCRIGRQTGEYNLLLSDNEIHIRQDNRVVIKSFSNNIDFTPTLVMTVAGGYDIVSQSQEQPQEV